MDNLFMVFNELEECVYIADIDSYELIFVNSALRKTLSVKDSDDPVGRKCYEVLQGNPAPCDFCTNSRLSEGVFYTYEHNNKKLDRHFLIKDKLFFWQGRKTRLEIALDITAQQEEKAHLLRDLKDRTTALECLQILEQEENIVNSFGKILEVLGAHYLASRAWILEFDQEKDSVKKAYEWTADNFSGKCFVNLPKPLSSASSWISAFSEKGEIAIEPGEKIEKGSFEAKCLNALGIDSVLIAPFMDEGSISGCLGLESPASTLKSAFLLKIVNFFLKSRELKQKANDLLKKMSLTDALTGIGNRAQYIAALNEVKNGNVHNVGILFVDVNGLKGINDRYGHAYGDRILVSVSRILSEIFGNNVFRTGGDEFIAICSNISRKAFMDKSHELRRRVKSTPGCQVSCGVTWRKSVDNVDALISYADDLMYLEKQSYYKDNVGRRILHQPALVEKTLHELERGQFLIYVQPKISLTSGKLAGVEALMRKKAGGGRVLSPADFIPILEAEHLIRHVDFFCLHESCRALSRWIKRGEEPVPISVNFSRLTLMEDDIVDKIVEVCTLYNVPCNLIDIEVTESIGVIDIETLKTVSHDILQKGFTLSLDDFGSKYCNFTVISEVEFTYLKLDKSLVDGILTNNRSQIILRHVIQAAKELKNITCVAEGIENEAQLNLLRKWNCDYGQGYIFAKPLSLCEFEQKYLIPKNEILSANG